MGRKFAERRRNPFRQCRRSGAVSEMVAQLGQVDFIHLTAPFGAGLKDARRTEQARFDGGADSFAALAVRESHGIADQQDARFVTRPRQFCSQVVGVPLEFSGQGKRHFSSKPQEFHKLRHLGRQVFFAFASQSDVQEVPLAKQPSIPLQIRTEEQFRAVPFDRAA